MASWRRNCATSSCHEIVEHRACVSAKRQQRLMRRNFKLVDENGDDQRHRRRAVGVAPSALRSLGASTDSGGGSQPALSGAAPAGVGIDNSACCARASSRRRGFGGDFRLPGAAWQGAKVTTIPSATTWREFGARRRRLFRGVITRGSYCLLIYELYARASVASITPSPRRQHRGGRRDQQNRASSW